MTLQPRPVDTGATYVKPLQCQEDAARFATTRESAAEQAAIVRANGHAEAIALLVKGEPGRAYAVVMRTWMRQVRVLGLSYAGIPGLPYDQAGELKW
jgi:hypothetical protein